MYVRDAGMESVDKFDRFFARVLDGGKNYVVLCSKAKTGKVLGPDTHNLPLLHPNIY